MSQVQLTFLWEERPASPSVLPDSEADSPTIEEISLSPIAAFCSGLNPDGLSGKMSPVSCRVTEDGTLVPYSGRWQNSGMGCLTEFSTLSSLEYPSDAEECSLSDILETGDVPRRFYLTAKACQGILRRAEKRGKVLPPQLARALQAVAGLEPTSTATGD